MEDISWLILAAALGELNMEFAQLYINDKISKEELGNGIGKNDMELIVKFKSQTEHSINN